MIADLAAICNVSANYGAVDMFLADLPTIEAKIPVADLEIVPFRDHSVFSLSIRNVGNRPLKMIDAELLVLEQFSPRLLEIPATRSIERFARGPQRWTGYRLTTRESTFQYSGVAALRESVTPSMGAIDLVGINLSIDRIL